MQGWPSARSIIRFLAALRYLGPRRAASNLRYRLMTSRWRPVRYAMRNETHLRWVAGPRVAFPQLGWDGVHLELPERRFTALGRTRVLGDPPDWEPEEPLLWLFNLHYFPFLGRLPPERRVALVLDWIERYPPHPRRPGWRPYPISLRLRNWTRELFASRLQLRDEETNSLLASIEAQGECLADTVEYHLGANHLLENAVTLKLLAACFAGPAVAPWERIADGILRRELEEQFLGDGGHFERSPMYHALLTGALLDLCNVLDERDPIRRRLVEQLPSALGFLAAMNHPDGGPALFNDCSLDVAPTADTLLKYAAGLGLIPEPNLFLGGNGGSGGAVLFSESGYHVWKGSQAAFFYDAGPIGPDYQPAHGHGDIFSFELSLEGRRVVVDGGTSTYEAGDERDWTRSTRAHNTVELDGEDQCEFFGAFRVGRRGRPRDVRAERDEGGIHVKGWHDGYVRLPGSPRHEREILFVPPGVLLVWDTVRSRREHRAVSRVRFAPGSGLLSSGAGTWRVTAGDSQLALSAFGGELTREEGWYAPRIGDRLPCEVLTLVKGQGREFGYALTPADIPVRIDAGGAQIGDRRVDRWP
jgi:hypothetical protein